MLSLKSVQVLNLNLVLAKPKLSFLNEEIGEMYHCSFLFRPTVLISGA